MLNTRRLIVSALILLVICYTHILQAQTPITSFTTTTFSGNTSQNIVVAPSDASNSLFDDRGETFTLNYAQGNDIRITSYNVGGTTYDRFILPDTLVLNRRVPSDRLVNIWYEHLSIVDNTPPTNDIINFAPAAASDADAIYQTLAVNAGYDNILVNVDDLASGSIQVETERVDVIWFQGIQTSTPANAVFPILERAGNDNVAVAAITSLNPDGTPASYGTLIGIGENFWTGGVAYTVPQFTVLRRETAGTNPIPLLDIGSQNVEGMALSFTELGISANQSVFGYSIFAADVVNGYVSGSALTSGPGTVAGGVTLTDISSYPNTTLSSDSGMDLIAGVSTAVSSDDNLVETKGPGGYKAALATWLKANEGVNTSVDGDNVTLWDDQWLGNNDAETSNNGEPNPVFRSTNSSINFNPTVDFGSVANSALRIEDSGDFNITNGPWDRKSFNFAFRTGDDITTKQVLYEQGGDTRGLNIYISGSSIFFSGWNLNAGDGFGAPWGYNFASVGIATDSEYIATFEYDGDDDLVDDLSGVIRCYINGSLIGTIPSVGLLYNHGADIGLGDEVNATIYSNGAGGTETTLPTVSFDGEISEFIYCNEPAAFLLSQRNRIESYLAIKYGITLDQSSPLNYFNSNGDVIFDATNNASIGGFLEFNHDIAGIGRDDASELDQPQSRSERDTPGDTDDGIVIIDRGSTISTDNTWLIWGNNDNPLTAVSSGGSFSTPAEVDERLQRAWRVSETNEVLTTSVSFDLASLGLSSNANDFSLLIAGNAVSLNGANNDPDFSNATVVTGGVFNGDVLTFSGIDLDDGQYFTLATSQVVCSPGGIETNLAVWLRADEGTSSTSEGVEVTSWSDQTMNNTITATGGTAPTYTASNINFNPALDFDGATEFMEGSAGLHSVGFYIVINPDDNITQATAGQVPIGYDVSSSGATENVGGFVLGDVSGGGLTNEVVTHLVGFNPTSYVRGEANASKQIDSGIPLLFHVRDNAGATESNISQNGLLVDNTDFIGSNTLQFTNEEFELGRFENPNQFNVNFFFDGKISEVISYSVRPTDTENNRIESYLALKYGITLDQASPRNYVASDGSTLLFDATNNEGAGGSLNYSNDIAGIGRDDTSCLIQKQSTSQNSGAIVTMGLGSIEASNAANPNTFTSDLDFLVWGDDGVDAQQSNANTLDVPGIVTERMQRIWRVEENGTVGATTIQFDLTGLGYSTNVSDFNLIVSNTTTMASGSTTPAASLVNNILTFNNIDLTDGQFFTIGTARTNCAPGGVQTNIQLWLRADAGTNTTTNGDPITSWIDQSGNGNDASSGTSPNFNSINNNFNPSINFDASNSEFLTIANDANLDTEEHAVFVIGTLSTGSGSYAPFIVKTGTYNWADGWGITRNNSDTETQYFRHGWNSGNNSISRTITNDVPFIHTAFTDATNYDYFLNLTPSTSQTKPASALNTVDELYLGASPDGAGTGTQDYLNGTISETIVFSSALSIAERERVASYLAIKYGITLSNTGGGTNGDYIRADGTNIWDASDYSSYHNDVAGIGRDDDGCFSQKQSSSANSDDILTVGLGSVANSNAENVNSFTENGDYFIWGNDNASTLQGDNVTNDQPPTISSRMARIWRADDTGNVGATELQFDLAGLGYTTGDASVYSLLISPNAGSPDMANAIIITGGTFNGDVLSFSGIDIEDGQYFTIGTGVEICGPGGVNTNLSAWFRGDLEAYSDNSGTTLATDGQDILEWGDQSFNARDAEEVDLGGGNSAIEPTFEANEFNFNPIARFTDANSTNNSYFRTNPSTTDIDTDFSIISVFKTGQSQGTDEDVLNSPVLISARDAGTSDFSMGMQNGTLWLDADSDNGFEAQTDINGTLYNDNQIHIATSVKNGTALTIFVDSENITTGTGNASVASSVGFGIGNHSVTTDIQAQFAGDIAETIVFSSPLSETEQARVESYLSIKYGLTRNVSALSEAAEDYLAADGAPVWDIDNQGITYYNDIFGIARDDLSCLNQTQSKSENSDAIITFNISGGFTENDAYLLSGNDNAVLEREGNTERPPGINSRLNREWRVQETGTVGTIELTYDMANITGPLGVGTNNLGQLRLLVDDDGDFRTNATLIEPASFNGTDNTVTFNVNFTSGQYYTLGSIERAALPVELLSFDALVQNDLVSLVWSTISEENNAFWTIERSSNGIDFEPIANLDGAGTSQNLVNYRYIDTNPLNGFSFYRLKQTDFSGEFDYSEVRSVYVERSKEVRIEVFPNPIMAGQILKLRHNLTEVQEGLIRVFDLNGRVSFSQSIRLDPMNNQIDIPTQKMKRGITIIKILLSEGKEYTFKVLVR